MENTAWIIVELVFACVHTTLTYLFVRFFLHQKKSEFVVTDGAVLVAAFATLFLSNFYFSENVFAVFGASVVTAFIIGKFYFQSKLAVAAITSLFAFLAGAVSELLAVVVITDFNTVAIDVVMQFGTHRLASRTLSSLFMLIFIMIVSRLRKSSMAKLTANFILGLSVLPIVSILIVKQFVLHIVDANDISAVNDAITILSIILVNIFVFVLLENIMRQNEKNQDLLLITAQSAAQQQHYNQIIDSHEQIKLLSHDFKQQTVVLFRLCNEGHYEELQKELSRLTSYQNEVLVIQTGNLMLDTVFSSKKEDALRKEINFEFDLTVQRGLQYMSMDICILLGNAIDNAIEACARSSSKDKFIKLDLKADSVRFLFYMKNTIGEIPSAEGKFLKSKKNDKQLHGIGLQSIKHISNKLGGDMTYEYNEKQFEIWIYLPVKKGLRGSDVQ